MSYKKWHRLTAVILVFALVFAMMPVQVFANENESLGEQKYPEQGDYNYIRLDSLVQSGRTITTAYYDVNELYRFSSYVTGSKGENSVVDFAMPYDGKMTVEIYNGEDFGNMQVDLKEQVTVLATLSTMYKQFTEEQHPLGYIAGYLYEGGGMGSVTEIEDTLKAQTDLYKMKKFDGVSSNGVVIPAPGVASSSVMSLSDEIQDQTGTVEPVTEPISMEKDVAEESGTFTVTRTVDTDDHLPYLHNFIRWEGRYVEYDEAVDAFSTGGVAGGDSGSEEEETWEPISEGETQVLTPGYYVLVFKYESEDNTYDNDVLLRDYARFLVVKVMEGNPSYPEATAATENGYTCVILDPSCGYTTMVRQLAGDPVELVSGSLNWNYIDLEISGVDPLAFTRTYHSLEADNEIGMGRGWAYSFYYRVKDLRNDLLLTLPTGGTLDFKLTSDGSYKVDDGNAYTLYRYSNGFKLTDEAGTVVVFDSAGRATSITNAAGKTIRITYNGNQFDTVSNESGMLTFTYSGDYITSITDSEGRTVHYTYADGNLTSFTNADCDTILYSYNSSHDLTEVTNFEGEVILQNEYDGRHRVVEQCQPNLGAITYNYDDANNTNSYTTEKGLTYTIVMDEQGRTLMQTEEFDGTTYYTGYTYDNNNRLAAITDRNGSVTKYEYDGTSNRQTKVIYPDGTSVRYACDPNGNVVGMIQRDSKKLSYIYENGLLVYSGDANGGVRTYSYNTAGHLASSTDALGNKTTYECNSAGLILKSTDPMGNTTEYEYDEAGRITEQITPLGNRYTYEYSSGGKLITETDPLGNQRTYTYNADGFVETETDWNGNIITNSYDVQNQLIAMSDALDHETSYEYDTDGNMISSTDPEGHKTAYTYDAMGRVTSYTDGNNNTTTYIYDGNGNMTSSTDPLDYTETYAYDRMDQATSYTDKRGNTTTTTYDKMGRITSVTDAAGRKTSYQYDANGNTISTTDSNGNTSYCEYDAENKLTKIITAEGNVTEFVYDKSGRLIGTKNALGHTTTGTYDADGNMQTEVSALGFVTAYEYDALGRVTKKTNPDGSAVSYTYDGNGNILTYTDGNGSTVTYTYDALNHLLTTTTPNGGVITNTYNDDGLLATSKDAEDRVTSYEYDGNHNITSITDGRGNTTYYTYDALNRLTGVTDPEGHTMTQVYDENGNLVSIIRPDQGVISYVYDKANQATSMTDAEGNVTTYVYDKNGNIIKEINPLGGVTTYTYDKENNLVKAVSPMENVTEYIYDSIGQLIATINANGEKTESEYDADGRLTSVTTALGLVTSYEYDEMGRLTKTINPDGTFTTATYDGNGNLLTFTDARGNTTTYTYDANGNLLTTTDPEGNTTKSSYNKNDEQVTYTDQKGGIVSFTYDANGNLASVTDKRGYKTSYTYDKNNRQTTTTDRTGAVTAFTYDGQGNVTSVTRPTGGVFTTIYDKNDNVTSHEDALGFTEQRTYDANGNLTSLTDRRGYVTRYEYDADDRLVKVVDALDGETTYTYDNIGQIIAITNALGDQTTTDYDDDNRPVKDSNELAEAESETHCVSYDYDLMGRVVKLTNEDGTFESYTYDENGNVRTITDENGNITSYTYNKNNQVLTITDPMGGVTAFTYGPTTVVSTETDALGGVTAYTYDENDNVISIKDPEGYITSYTYDGEERIATTTDANGNVYRYTYDGNGNLIKVENPDGGIELYTYDLNDQLISFTDTEGYKTTYVYDGNGNLIKVTDPRGNSQISEYDALNRPTVLTNEEGGKITYTYDALGRVIKAVNEDGAVTEYEYDAKGRTVAIKNAYGNFRRFVYDPMDRIVADTDENGVRRTYEYDAKGNLVKYTDGLGNSETYTYDKNDNRISLTDRNGYTYTYTYDALNRVTSETDPKGNTKYFTYDKNSRIVAVTDRNGNTTQYKLDGNGNIVETIDAADTSSLFEYDSMNRLVKIKMHRVDTIHNVNEWQETLYTYDHRGLVKTEVNAMGDGKVFVYDGNGNLISKTDEDGYVTEYEYSPVNLVSKISYDDGQTVSYLYDGTGDLIEMTDWNGTTTIGVDLQNRIIKVTDHNDLTIEYGYDAVGNKTSQGYPDGTQVDYWYDAENQIVQVQDFDGGVINFAYDPNGNKVFKEYPNYETAFYFYDKCNQVIEMDEYKVAGSKLYKTLYTYDAEGNRLSDRRYNHGQSTNGTLDSTIIGPSELQTIGGVSVTQDIRAGEDSPQAVLALQTADPTVGLASLQPIAIPMALPTDEMENTPAGALIGDISLYAQEINQSIIEQNEAAAAAMEANGEPESTNSGNDDATIEGNGNGNGEVPPGQSEDEDGNIVNNGGNMAPGLNRGTKIEKPDNPNPPSAPVNPGTEDKFDTSAKKGTNIYSYDELNRLTEVNDGGTISYYTYDTLGNLIREQIKSKITDYRYNKLNQLVSKTAQNQTYSYSYDGRGNRIAEYGKKASQSYFYDATNRMVHGTNWKGDTSFYTYNGLGLRINNTIETHAGKVYTRDYVIDYTSLENDDLFVYATGNGTEEYVQKHVYAGSERLEQITERGSGNWERTLYVHEDVMGNTYYFTKSTGGTFADLEYDAWGMPQSTNKLVNNDHGNFVFATYTGHIYDTTLDIYFAEARFYDATNRSWLAIDPIKDGNNWYQYCGSNPTTRWDPTGMSWWDNITNVLKTGLEKAKNSVSNRLTEIKSNATSYFKKTACSLTKFWNDNKNELIMGGALVLTSALTFATGGTAMLLIGIGTGAFQSGLSSYLNQKNSGFAVDWGAVGKEALKGGIISGIAGGIGGVLANVAKPLNFCGKAAMEIAGDVLEHWAIGTAGDTAVGMIATYVSERFDGKSPQEAFQSTMSSADDIIINAAITSAAGTAFDSFMAPKCFVAGTMVTTAAGLVAIENIQPGDVVLAANEETGEVAYKEVVRTFVNTTDEITHVTIENAEGEQETIDSTPEHPFYVEGLGWVEASSLHAGMTIWFANGTKGTVEDISNEGLEEPVTVYNFEVTDFHTYFVGENAVLVHNDCDTDVNLPEFDGQTTEGVLVLDDGTQIALTSGNADPNYKNYISASHVEGKAAVYMRENSVETGVVYHNNCNGTCPYCNKMLSTLLPEGSSLTVVPPADANATRRGWVDTIQTFFGNSNDPKPPK